MKIPGIWAVLLAFLFLIGCSESPNPVTGGIDGENTPIAGSQSSQTSSTNRVLWGLWKIRIPADQSSIEVVPDRTGAAHFNVVRLLEVNPCTTCLAIQNVQWLQNNIVQADLRLRHPFPGIMRLTGFDVRGIFISEGNYEFPASERRIARGTTVPRMLNPDGYTSLFNPTEFPEGSAPFPILAYITGRFSNGNDLTATLNPYVAYGVDNPRRLFPAGSVEAQTVQIYYPDLPMEFGYAVDASWMPVDGEVTDPVTDFPPEANCMEAYRIAIQGGESIELSGSEPEEIFIEVFDHQGLETISSVSVEAPDLFGGVVDLEYSEPSGPDCWVFSGKIANEFASPTGDYPILVRVEDAVEDPNLGQISAWELTEVSVQGGYSGGWARTWGGENAECSYSVAFDGYGCVYVTGVFLFTVDFNPDGGDPHTALGIGDVFLSKFDSTGDFLWVRTWGDEGTDEGKGVAVDNSGDVYVIGRFMHTVDFDPDGGDLHISNGNNDVFLSKFDSSGSFQWARTWGGKGSEEGNGVAVDGYGDVHVTGSFRDTVDFDPNGGDPRVSEGHDDVFLTKFSPSGNFQWARTWGSTGWDIGYGVAGDESGNIYVTGIFQETVNFDPNGYDPHTSNGGGDAFLSRFDSSGNFEWARIWGGSDGDWAKSVASDNSGNVFIAGYFKETVDFDPNGGDPHTSNGGLDVFLSSFDASGDFQWARTWGGPAYYDQGYDVAATGLGDIYVIGSFHGLVDFNPSGGDPHTSNGQADVFLSKFDTFGNFIWARNWGGLDDEVGFAVSSDGFGNVYTTGYFKGTANFAPADPPCDNDSDEHTSNGVWDAFLTRHLPDGCW